MSIKKLSLLAASTFAAIALGTATQAGAATTVTFEGANNSIYNAPITRSGVVFGNVVGDEQHFHEINSTQFGLASNGTGVLLNDRNTRIFMNLTDNSTFSLTSFDIAASFANSPGLSFNVLGYLNGNVVYNASGALGQFITVLAGVNVDYVVFDGIGGGGGFELDNVTIDAAINTGVPEPATWGMMILGFGLVGASMRRRRGVAAMA